MPRGKRTPAKILEDKAKVEETTLESDSPETALSSKYAKLSFTDIEHLIRLHKDGRTQVEIAALLSCSQSTVSATLAKLKDTPEVVQALMKGEAFEVLEQWKHATKIAAKRGDHRPAREWIEAAHPELRPQQGNNAGGGGVTVHVHVPGAVNPLPVIDVQPLSPLQLSASTPK